MTVPLHPPADLSSQCLYFCTSNTRAFVLGAVGTRGLRIPDTLWGHLENALEARACGGVRCVWRCVWGGGVCVVGVVVVV